MEQRGTVMKIENGIAFVAVKRMGNCGEGCGKDCSLCASAKETVLQAKAVEELVPGEWVTMVSRRGRVTLMAFLLYILPLLGAAGCYVVGDALGCTEGTSALLAFVGLFLWMLPAFFYNRRMKKTGDFGYEIRREM